MSEISITVIIPVKNGEDTLVKCLNSIRQQTIGNDIEILILDSCSIDNSVQIAKDFGASVYNIPHGKFNHGLTRNEGVKYAKGEFIYFTVQDAYLPEKNQLEQMVAHFKDSQLMAVTGLQVVPHDKDKNPALWFRRFSKPGLVIKEITLARYQTLNNKEKYALTQEWDDVNAMYRKSALLLNPFEDTQFAEDKLWARSALLKGMKIAFDSSLIVYHYHHSTFSYSFNLQYTVNYYIYKHFHFYPAFPVFFKTYFNNIYQLWKNHLLSIKEKIYWSIHNFFRLSGYTISTILFIIIGKCFGNDTLDKSYNFFCKRVPQGKSK